MTIKQNKYYPCDICGEDTPHNTVKKNSQGQKQSRCPMHQWRDDDKIASLKIAKRKTWFLNELQKGIVTEE